MRTLSSALNTFTSSCTQTFGNGSIAQAIFSDEKNALISDLAINIGYGLGLMMGIYVAIGVTGAHLNPAVTLAMALRGKTSWIKVCTVFVLIAVNSHAPKVNRKLDDSFG